MTLLPMAPVEAKLMPKPPFVLMKLSWMLSGRPVDTGRPEVSADYDLAILVEFDSVDAYRAWLASPAHRDLVRTWKPRWSRATIVDFAP